MFTTSFIFRSASSRPGTLRRRGGFTLIEAALATVIIGVGVLAMLELLATGTSSNIDSAQLTTANNLSKQIREMTIQQTFAEVLALNGVTYDPPQDASGLEMDELSGWKQTINVQAVDPNLLTLDIIDANPSAVRVSVIITHANKKVLETSWHRFK